MAAPPSSGKSRPDTLTILLWVVIAGLIAWFYTGLGRFNVTRTQPAVQWLVGTWHGKNANWEHAWLVVVVMGWLFWRAAPKMFAEPESRRFSRLGAAAVVFGLLLFVAGVRTLQPRLNIIALLPLVFGCMLHAWGWARARHAIFPLSMIAFMIPVPNLEQMTTGLQIIATKMAHHSGNLLGIETVIAGNHLQDPTGGWSDWEIDEGCSGIRSLVALTLISYLYAMLVHTRWRERLVIFASSIPIAIFANAVRVTSIIVVARFNLAFAKGPWHDYSGFLSFGVALSLLMLVSKVMRFGLRALRPTVKVTRTDSPAKPETVSNDAY